MILPFGLTGQAFAGAGGHRWFTKHQLGRPVQGRLVLFDDHQVVPTLLAAVKPTIDAGGRLILLSTADKAKPQSAFERICGAGGRPAMFGCSNSRPQHRPADHISSTISCTRLAFGCR
jgi:hypothetical protein